MENMQKQANKRTHITITVLYTSIFWLIVILFQSNNTISRNPLTKILACGNSTAEARSLGCKFDSLSFLWVPEQCYDAEMDQAYQKAVNWHGYNDAEGKEKLDLEQMSERVEPFKYYTTAREHTVHCAYVWQKQHRGYLKGGFYLDDNSASFHHTRHCSEVLIESAEMDPEKLARFTTETTVGFSSCRVEL